jgi:hypothetical protein
VVVGALNPRSPWGVVRRRELREPPWKTARFLCRHEFRNLARPYERPRSTGPSSPRDPYLARPRMGPLIERLGELVPSIGAFQVLITERR